MIPLIKGLFDLPLRERAKWLRENLEDFEAELKPGAIVRWIVVYAVIWAVVTALCLQALGVTRLTTIGPTVFGGLIAVTARERIGFMRRRVSLYREALALIPPFCEHCEYDLTGIPVGRDGCAVCPECGGVSRVVSGSVTVSPP